MKTEYFIFNLKPFKSDKFHFDILEQELNCHWELIYEDTSQSKIGLFTNKHHLILGYKVIKNDLPFKF